MGLLLGGLGALLGWLARRRPWARLALGASSAFLGLVLGLLGTILVFLWIATDHRVAHANANILQAAPFALALTVYGVKLVRARSGAARKAFLVLAAALLLSLLGCLGKMTGLLSQDNGPIIGFFLPLWLGLTVGLGLCAGLRLRLGRLTLP